MGTVGSEGMGEVLKNVGGGLMERKGVFWVTGDIGINRVVGFYDGTYDFRTKFGF